MTLNADFSTRVVVHSDSLEWQPSPMPGVDRRMLDRIGDEVARATTIVRYAPGSHFSAHTHHGGEEFIVLEGVFQDEHGDFPVGTYVRNPPTSSHTPGSDAGCTIFVKLWQFDPDDRTQVRVDMAKRMRDGVALLHRDDREEVTCRSLQPNEVHAQTPVGGAEVLVLSGEITEQGDKLRKGGWLRVPDGAALDLLAGPEGATLWVKTGHLRFARAPDV